MVLRGECTVRQVQAKCRVPSEQREQFPGHLKGEDKPQDTGRNTGRDCANTTED